MGGVGQLTMIVSLRDDYLGALHFVRPLFARFICTLLNPPKCLQIPPLHRCVIIVKYMADVKIFPKLEWCAWL